MATTAQLRGALRGVAANYARPPAWADELAAAWADSLRGDHPDDVAAVLRAWCEHQPEPPTLRDVRGALKDRRHAAAQQPFDRAHGCATCEHRGVVTIAVHSGLGVHDYAVPCDCDRGAAYARATRQLRLAERLEALARDPGVAVAVTRAERRALTQRVRGAPPPLPPDVARRYARMRTSADVVAAVVAVGHPGELDRKCLSAGEREPGDDDDLSPPPDDG